MNVLWFIFFLCCPFLQITTAKLCSVEEWQCGNGACVAEALVCDGAFHCDDGSDETLALCAGIERPLQELKRHCLLSWSWRWRAGVCPATCHFSSLLCTNSFLSNAAKSESRRDLSCEPPSVFEHGEFFRSISRSRPTAAVLEFRCAEGHLMSGNRTVRCRAGFWDTAFPTCYGVCKLIRRPGVEYRCLVQGGGEASRECGPLEPHGTVVRTHCAPNYHRHDVATLMHCLAGLWVNEASCEPECGLVTPSGRQLMIGGREAEHGELPWVVAVYSKRDHNSYKQICSGSIVSADHVISAAHCFSKEGETPPASAYAVAAGKTRRAWNHPADTADAQHRQVKSIRIPLSYGGMRSKLQSDLAVLEVAEPFLFTAYVRPVCLDFQHHLDVEQLAAGNVGTVAGWGMTDAEGAVAEPLRVTQLPVVDAALCQKRAPESFREYITSDKFCAGFTDGSSALCEGDSGGGLVFQGRDRDSSRYYLRGVVSDTWLPVSELCNPRALPFFTHLLLHRQFLDESLSLHSQVTST